MFGQGLLDMSRVMALLEGISESLAGIDASLNQLTELAEDYLSEE